jgi:branched-chain amino acid transport system permease protein
MTAYGDVLTPVLMGFMLGGLYALIALGLSMVFGVMKLLNVAHGDFVVLGSYLAYGLMTALGLDPILSLLISAPFMFFLGFFLQKYILDRAFAISVDAPLIITFGIGLIIQNTNQIIWAPVSRGINTSYTQLSFHLGQQQFPLIYLMDFTIGVILMLVLRQFLSRTYLGRAISASSQDKKAAQLMGINTKLVYCYACAIAIVSAGIAGSFLGMTFPFTPSSGGSFLAIAFGAVVIGGLGSMLGTFIGGMVLGMVQTVGGYYLGPAFQMLIVYVVVLAVLAVRPQGLLGH